MDYSRRQARVRWLVDPEFQLSFLGYSIGVAFTMIAVFYISQRWVVAKLLEYLASSDLSSPQAALHLVQQLSSRSELFFLSVALAVVIFHLVVGLYLSNRVVGPIFRLRAHLIRVHRGETLEPLEFRRTDYFSDLADIYNAHLAVYRQVARSPNKDHLETQ